MSQSKEYIVSTGWIAGHVVLCKDAAQTHMFT